MSAFEKYFEGMSKHFPSDASRYFTKPLLKDAWDASAAHHKPKGKKAVGIVAGDIVVSGRTGASDAEG